MILSTVAINAVNRVSGGKRLFLASLQQTCNEYLYLNINKCELAFLLQKPSSDSLVICFREACLVTMIHTPEPEHGALRHRAQCSETLSTVLWDTDHGTLRHWAQCSETQTTVLWDTEHSALRHRARCSENQSTPELHVLHMLTTYSTCSYPG